MMIYYEYYFYYHYYYYNYYYNYYYYYSYYYSYYYYHSREGKAYTSHRWFGAYQRCPWRRGNHYSNRNVVCRMSSYP